MACCRGHEASKVPPAVLGLIVELLCFCVAHHSYRIKYYILRNNVLSKALSLAQSPQPACISGAL